MAIVCSGSIAYDFLMTFPGYFKDHILPEHLEKISLSFLVDSMIRQRGGTAPNIAYNLALLGECPVLFGTVGEDFEDYRTWLESNQIDTRGVKVIQGDYTASFFCNTDRSNSQIASFYPGAMGKAGELSLAEFEPGEVDLLIISPNDPSAMYRNVDEAITLKIPYLYDPSQQIIRMDLAELRKGVEHSRYLFVNDYEFELLQKHAGLKPDRIIEAKRVVVVTCGEHGAKVYAKGEEFFIPVVPPVAILDPTGVGDAFRAGFVRGMRLGFDWQTCGQMGALSATYCLEQRGTQNHRYSIHEYIQRYRQHFDDHRVLDRLIQVQSHSM
jgi:adenosine kinase